MICVQRKTGNLKRNNIISKSKIATIKNNKFASSNLKSKDNLVADP